jgi:hypothetical protein
MMVSTRENTLVLRQLQKLQLRQTKLMEELIGLKEHLSDARQDFDEKFMECDALGDSVKRMESEWEQMMTKESGAQAISTPNMKESPATSAPEASTKQSNEKKNSTAVPTKGSSSIPMKNSSRFNGSYDRDAYMWSLVENELKRWLIKRPTWSHIEWMELLKKLKAKGYTLDFSSKVTLVRMGNYLESNRSKITHQKK